MAPTTSVTSQRLNPILRLCWSVHTSWSGERTGSISHDIQGIPEFPGLQTLVRIQSERQECQVGGVHVSHETRDYVASLTEPVQVWAERIRGYWGVENKVHHVRDVTQGEDASRICTPPLVQIWALARNVALKLYRDNRA